jgi:hypothetical protein
MKHTNGFAGNVSGLQILIVFFRKARICVGQRLRPTNFSIRAPASLELCGGHFAKSSSIEVRERFPFRGVSYGLTFHSKSLYFNGLPPFCLVEAS